MSFECENLNLLIAASAAAGTIFGAGVTYWNARRQAPKPDVRIDEVKLMALSIGEGENTFIAKVTNHGNAVADILSTEVKVTIDNVPIEASIGARHARGTLAAGTSKELWLNVSLPQGTHDEVHHGRKSLRVTPVLSLSKGKPIQAGFYFSHSPSYGFIPIANLDS